MTAFSAYSELTAAEIAQLGGRFDRAPEDLELAVTKSWAKAPKLRSHSWSEAKRTYVPRSRPREFESWERYAPAEKSEDPDWTFVPIISRPFKAALRRPAVSRNGTRKQEPLVLIRSDGLSQQVEVLPAKKSVTESVVLDCLAWLTHVKVPCLTSYRDNAPIDVTVSRAARHVVQDCIYQDAVLRETKNRFLVSVSDVEVFQSAARYRRGVSAEVRKAQYALEVMTAAGHVTPIDCMLPETRAQVLDRIGPILLSSKVSVDL